MGDQRGTLRVDATLPRRGRAGARGSNVSVNIANNNDCRHFMAPMKRSRAEQARQILSRGAVLREDSDDELGYEDHPWEWMYEDVSAEQTLVDDDATPRQRKAAPISQEKRIVGARMGSFRCKIGDAVLLKADGNQAWVGIICDFYDDEDDEKMAKFLWFSSEQEIRNKNKKRADFLQVGHATLSTEKWH